jgi:hypothetical protein
VQLDGALSGPSPWHVHGKATFRIWRFGKSVRFDATVGEREALPPAPVADPLPALLAALAEPASWEASLPPREEMLVTLRDARGGAGGDARRAAGEVRAHPLGSVSVRQRVLPLDVPVTRFGGARVARERSYRIDGVELGGQGAPVVTPLLDHFARGLFQEMSQGERLSRPSFEPMQAGVRIATEALTYGGSAVPGQRRDTALEYETVLLTEDPAAGGSESTTLTGGYRPPVDRARQQAEFGAAARSATRGTGARRFAVARPAQTQVQLLPVQPRSLHESELVSA